MEEYSNNSHLNENTGPGPSPRANFLYSAAVGGSSVENHHHLLPINTFHLQSGGSGHCHEVPHPNVKTESNFTSQLLHTPIFHYPLMRGSNLLHPHPSDQQQEQGGSQSSNEVEAIKAKIIAHPQYSNLLQVYMECQKVLNN